MLRSVPLRALCALFLALATMPAAAGPQHWGTGMSYLAAIEQIGTDRRLAVYEGPVRAKDAAWISRWIDTTTNLNSVAAGGIAVGNFWPASFGKEYLALVGQSGSTVTIRVLEPPEVFRVGQWALKSTSTVSVSGTVVCAAAGDLLGLGRDQLLLAVADSPTRVVILTPPTNPTGTNWSISRNAALPGVTGTPAGLACGDFWNENLDSLAVAVSANGATGLSFYSFDGTSFSLITSDEATDLPALSPGGLTAADYVQDGFDTLTLTPADASAAFQVRSAPARPGQQYDPGPQYNGRAYSRAWLPGNGGASSKLVMTGTFGNPATGRTAIAAGRVFGYINSSLGSQFAYSPATDAEIAFASRFPTKDLRPPYGWPAKNEAITYDIGLKNNGGSAIAAGSATLRVWINTPYRNADTNPATSSSPDYTIPVNVSLPAFNPSSPAYAKFTVGTAWPYDLIPAAPGATWKKVNVEEVGERWLVVTLECAGDTNARNNRYEAALHALTFRPIFRSNATLADRGPTVQGDPCSKEYLSRKLADAITLMWERSGTTANEDVLQRVFFDGYEIGWPDDLPEPARSEKWQQVQSKYEGWRELDGWWGLNQSWETGSWAYAGEWHETGHLFHPIGDLYQYYAHPVWTGAAKMADGTPVQIATHCWGADSFAEGQSMIGPPACEQMKRCLVGVRNASIQNWETLAPDRIWVRVLDRQGSPVPGAEVKLFRYGSSTPEATGTTGADGRWEITSLWGSPTVDEFGRKHYYSAKGSGLLDTLAHVFTVTIGNYQDSAIWGSEDVASHSRYALFHHSYVSEAGWTWDLRTSYQQTAPEPSFTLEAAVQGNTVQLGISGAAGATYRLYRRWQPTYVRTLVGEYSSSGATLSIPQDMAAADSYRSGRSRAVYEVTQVSGGVESLPRVVQVTGLTNARGVTARPDGKLLVASNSGIANPFCTLFEGTAPYQEYFYHFRFGHTASKAVPSKLVAGKYYATLASSDMNPDYRFDLISPPAGGSMGYDVRNEIGHFTAVSYTSSSPFSITLASEQQTAQIHPGDAVQFGSSTAQVTSVAGAVLTVNSLIFSGQTNPSFTAIRCAGRPGSIAASRQLNAARGLATILHGGREYIAIADTGNRRVVIWDDATGYITLWQSTVTGARPAAIAPHPTEEGKFFLIDRRASRPSKLYAFTFDGSALAIDAGYPVDVDVADYSGVSEMGLAAAVDPTTGGVLLAVTDAAQNRVLELRQDGQVWQTAGVYTVAVGTFAGSAALNRPGDVAYVAAGGALRMYAVDGSNRLVLLTQRDYASVTPAAAKQSPEGSRVFLAGAVSAVFASTSSFYVQSADRSSGIQVRYSPGTARPEVGQAVTVGGDVHTDLDTGERYVSASGWQPAEYVVDLGPLGMNTRALGGAANGLQTGVHDGSGLNNIGLLVRTAGSVSSVAPDAGGFHLFDGSSADDGSGESGVRIDMSEVPGPQRPPLRSGDVVTVAGVSGMRLLGSHVHRQVRLRSSSDIGFAGVPPEVYWYAISGPVSETAGTYNHIGTDGSSVYAVFGNQQFWRYSFTGGDPGSGAWTRLADPPRTVCYWDSYSDLAFSNGYLYTSAKPLSQYDPQGYNRTILRYRISDNNWQVWQSGGADVVLSSSSGNGLFMDPAADGVGYSAWHAGGCGWVTFDWNAQTASNCWMSYNSVSRNEDTAFDGSGTYYATHNDWEAGLSAGDLIYRWTGLTSPSPAALVQKPWQAGMGQSIEFVPASITPSGHNELWLIRGSDSSGSSFEGWGSPTADWARLDLTTGQWVQTGALPGGVGYNGEAVLVDGSVFVRGTGANWYVARLH